MFSIDGKTVLITGAGTGTRGAELGAGCARILAAQGARFPGDVRSAIKRTGRTRRQCGPACFESSPVPRFGTADDLAAACLYLASDEAGWVTGQVIGVNGGTIMTQ